MTTPSTGQVKLQNTQYCLDAGNDPQLGDYLELQPCGNNPEGNAGQEWDWTSDSQLKTENGGYLQSAGLRRGSDYGVQCLVLALMGSCRSLLGSAIR